MSNALHMTGTQLQTAIMDLARLTWLCVHFRPAQVRCKYCRGKGCGRCKDGWTWRTAVEGDGKGFPDLILLHKVWPWLLFVEVKGDGDQLRPDQERWLEELDRLERSLDHVANTDLRILVDVWKPKDWTSGTIERILKEGP